MKQFFTKKLIMLLLMVVGANAAWADDWSINFATIGTNNKLADKAGAAISETKVTINKVTMGTVTLGEQLNENFVMQTETTWLYRTAQKALYSQNGGGRSFGVNNAKKGQLITLVISAAPTPYNATLKSTDGNKRVYSVDADGGVAFNLARYNYIYSIEVSTPTATTADYTVKYVCGDTEIQSVTRNDEVGTTPTFVADPIYKDGKKYIFVSDDASGKKIAADGSTVVTLTYREASVFTINAKYEGNIISTSQVFEGDNGNVYVPYYQFVDGTLYKNPTVDKGTRSYGQVSVSNVTADTDINVSYTADDNQNVVFFAEAENISTLKPYEDQYTQIRMSNGKVGYAAEDGAVVATLPSGKFTIECSTRAGETSFFAGDVNVFTISSTGSVVTTTSEEFELSAATDITVNAGSNKSYFDYVLIRKTGEAKATCTVSSVGWATFCAPADFEVANADEVYYAKSIGESSVSLTALEAGSKVKAGEGVLVKTEGEHSFALASDATAIEGNLLIGAASATELGEGEAYILANQDGNAVFALCSAGTIAAGKAYLPASIAGAPTLQFVFDDEATSIQSATEATVCKPQTTGSYNLAGQRVANGYKGIVVKNGVKVLVK